MFFDRPALQRVRDPVKLTRLDTSKRRTELEQVTEGSWPLEAYEETSLNVRDGRVVRHRGFVAP
jgi:hypothetical protein